MEGSTAEGSTMERRYDLTQLVWSSEDLYMSTLWVEVTATVGAHRSQPATSNTFTFNNVETANLTCESPGVGVRGHLWRPQADSLASACR